MRHHLSAMLIFIFALLMSASILASDQDMPPAGIENSLGMKFVLVPAGEFLMGSDESPEELTKAFPQYEQHRVRELGDEAPVHRVRITQAFYLGQFEVTVGQFRKFIETSGYIPQSVAYGAGGYGYNKNYDPTKSKSGDAFEGRDPKYSWRNTGFEQGDNHPVVNVTWNDAVALAKWLSESEGVKYRLPTEAEWEYACRAGTRTRYANGDNPESLIKIANIFDSDSKNYWLRWALFALPSHDGFAFTSPVGSFAPNAWGLYDMHGNVWEWVSDWYADDYYARSPIDDPQGPIDGDLRVRRGGSWHTWALYARSSYRNYITPNSRYILVGMRLVREVPAH